MATTSCFPADLQGCKMGMTKRKKTKTYCICFHYARLWSSHLVKPECGSRCPHYSIAFLVSLSPAGIRHLSLSPPSCPKSCCWPKAATRHSAGFVSYCWWLGEGQRSYIEGSHTWAEVVWTLMMTSSVSQSQESWRHTTNVYLQSQLNADLVCTERVIESLQLRSRRYTPERKCLSLCTL